MKKVALFLSLLILSACSNADSEPEAIEEPTVPDTEISANNNLIQSFQEKIASDQEEIKNTDSEHLKNIYKESIKDWEKEIELIEEENKILEETLIYNDEFSVIKDTAVFVNQHESILNESTLISSFHKEMINTLTKYKDEFSNGALMVAAVPFRDDEEKHPMIVVFFEQSTLDNIDFEKATDDDESRYLYDKSDYIGVFSALSNQLKGHGDIYLIPEVLEDYLFMTY